jgi:type I restriction enzyme S subunit
VAILRPNPESLRPDYLSTMLGLPNLGQRLIRAAQYGQTKPGLNFEQIRGFSLPRPSLERQDEFLLRKASVDKIRTRMSAELGQTEELFASLQSRAFRGEL